MKTHLLCLIHFTAFLCLSTVTHADIAPEPISGGISIVVPGSSQTEIALLHNTVKMQVSPTLCKTRAFFRLRNTGKATKLEVGFPLMYEGEAADFQVFIDDKLIPFKDKTKETKTPIGQPHTLRWKVWPMKFEEGATHLVEARYSNPITRNWSAWDYYASFRHTKETGWDYDLSEYGLKEPVQLSEWLKIKTVEYILVTGSYWKGPIKRCRVEADIENVATDSMVGVLPSAKSFSSKKIIWEWKNVEPARNVALSFVGGVSPRQKIIPYLEKIAAQNPEDEKITETLEKIKQDFTDEKIKERQKTFTKS